MPLDFFSFPFFVGVVGFFSFFGFLSVSIEILIQMHFFPFSIQKKNMSNTSNIPIGPNGLTADHTIDVNIELIRYKLMTSKLTEGEQKRLKAKLNFFKTLKGNNCKRRTKKIRRKTKKILTRTELKKIQEKLKNTHKRRKNKNKSEKKQ